MLSVLFLVTLSGLSGAETLRDTTLIILDESFDSVSAPNLPAGWTVINNDADAFTWKTHNVNPISAPNSLWSSFSNAEPKDDYLLTPPLQLTGGNSYFVSFKYRSGDRAWEKFRVLLGDTPTVAGLSTLVFNQPGFMNPDPQTVTATFSIETSGSYYLAWHHFSDAQQYILSVDDIVVGEGSPNPPNRPYLSYPYNGTDYASVLGVELRWTQTYPSGPPTHWKVYMSQNPASVLSDHCWTSYYSHFNPVTEGGLSFEYEQTWYWTVEAFNASGSALALEPRWFQTHSDPTVTVFPYQEYFDAVQAPDMPPGWTVHDANGDGFTWSTGAGGSLSFPNSLTIFTYADYCKRDWAISPPLVLEGGSSYALDFWYSVSSGTPENLKVTLGNSTLYTQHTNVLFTLEGFSNWSPEQAQVLFTPAVSGTYYLGWNAYSPINSSVLRLDNIYVELLASGIPDAPELVSPGDGATGLDLDGFELTWSPGPDGGAPTSYKVYLAQDADPVLEGQFWTTPDTHFDPVTQGGLVLGFNQIWYWTVEAINSYGNTLAASVYSFVTQEPDTVMDFPWLEDFEGGVFPPQHWSSWKIYEDSPREWQISTLQSHSGTHSAMHGRNSQHSSEGWLVSPALALPGSGPMMLSFWNYSSYQSYYEYVGVYVSTGSPDPADGDFEELWSPSYVEALWNQIPVSLEDYVGQSVYIGFCYIGANASEWFIDDVRVSDLTEYINGPVISLRRHLNTYQHSQPYPIEAQITDADGIHSAELHYQLNYGTFISVPMLHLSGDRYLGQIPAQPLNTHVAYYLTATDGTAFNTMTETGEYEFEVEEPAWLSYQEGDQAAVLGHASQNWEARVIYPNPGGPGAPLQVNALKARLLFPGSAVLQVFSYENELATPLMDPMPLVFPYADTEEVFDLGALGITVYAPYFMISLSDIPAYNYIPVTGPSLYADMNFYGVAGNLTSLAQMGLDRVYQIEAQVQSSTAFLAAPQISISHNPAGILLNWNSVAGASSYKVYAAPSPDGPWAYTATTGETGISFDDNLARYFFRVTSSSATP